MKLLRIELGWNNRPRSSLTTGALVCAFHGLATNASASECVGMDLCTVFEPASAVFVGRVESITESRYVGLAVLEPFGRVHETEESLIRSTSAVVE
jgi:hypothetical protein